MNRCEEVLIHHGVKDMKWGIRRYQNPDGTLTAAGKKRLEKSERRNVYAKRIESKAVDRERKNSSAMLKTANKEWKSNNKEVSIRQEKQFKDANKGIKSELSKKEQKSNLKELSKLSKSSGFDSAMKKLDRGDSAGFEKDMDRIRSKGVPKSNVIDKIAQSKSVTNAQKEHDKAQSEWTRAQTALDDYVKKNGYPQSDKHSETIKDPTYNRLQETVDKAYDANSRAYDKLQKSIYSEMGKQIGKDPTADNLEAIRYMIELQIK